MVKLKCRDQNEKKGQNIGTKMEKSQNVRTKNAFTPFFFHKNFAKNIL